MTPEDIDRIALRVYRARLDDACPGDADRQVEKDGDDGAKQARRARFYRPAVAETLIAVGLHERASVRRPTATEDASVFE